MVTQSKSVACSCGHVSTLEGGKLLCIKCGRYVFYDERDKKAHRRNSIIITAMVVSALGLVAYLFVEMVLAPILPR